MKIDIKSKNSLYIELNDYVYYIDDSTNEQIMNCYHNTSMGKDIPPIYCNIEAKNTIERLKKQLHYINKKYLLLIDYVDEKQIEGCEKAQELLNYKLI